jgi:hypothetical protein
LRPGKTVEVRGLSGNVTAEPADDDAAETAAPS